MTVRPCIVCGALTDGTRCPDHRRPAWRSSRTQGMTTAQRGYDSAWQRARRAQLRTEPQCRGCGAPATEVDHIIPIADGGARLDPGNLASVCTTCHRAKTLRDAHRAQADPATRRPRP